MSAPLEGLVQLPRRRPARPAAAPVARSTRPPAGYESLEGVRLTEPRIPAIERELRHLLSLVQLESHGRPVEIDGFRLRDLQRWADYPSSLSDIFWHLSSVCNFDCEFCYEKGNPADFPIQNTPRMATPGEIATRLRHYDPARRTGLFSLRSSINEPFANKRALEYLRWMRARAPQELISFVTNGAYLTRDVVAALAELQPLFFNLSLYSTDSGVRREVLRDRRGGVAVEAVPLLAEHRIAYMSNLVMWPTIPLEDLERSIAFMDEHRAALIRVCLGGYSRYLPGEFPRFTVEEYWPQVVAEVERLRPHYRIPILIEPNSYVTRDTETRVDGVVVDSPAALAGVRRGDRVRAVNGRPVAARMELISALRRAGGAGQGKYRPPGVAAEPAAVGSGRRRVTLELERAGQHLTVELERYDPRAMETYPYGAIAAFEDCVFGLVLTDTLRYSSLKEARDLILARGAHKVLLVSSQMVEPILRHMIERTDAFRGLEVHVRAGVNHYFGGTINVGDLLVVDDYVRAIRDFVAEAGAPELVLIPASPFASSPWGRDLTGRPWTEIERRAGVPVALVPCANITF